MENIQTPVVCSGPFVLSYDDSSKIKRKTCWNEIVTNKYTLAFKSKGHCDVSKGGTVDCGLIIKSC